MYKNSKFTILLPTVIACSLAAGMLLGSFLLRSGADRPARRAALSVAGTDKLNMLLRLIDAQYVDTVRMDSLTEEIIPLILENLDPHSMYFSAKDLAQANETIEGEFDGIGVVFNMATDTVIVLNVIAGGPSAKAGIQGGDRIVTVEDSTIAGVEMDQNEVVKRLRGPRGSEVRLGIQRSGIDGLIPVTVRRDAIPIKSITASYLIRPDIGYIKFDQFSVNAYKELSEAIGQLKGQGMQKLILDIRGNSGGLLEQAIAISNEFLPADKMIVYTQDRAGNRETQYSDGQGEFTDEQLVVLIDEYSASSSEILAGALQDNDRGTIIGRRSYGKGLVQSQIPFPDGSAVRDYIDVTDLARAHVVAVDRMTGGKGKGNYEFFNVGTGKGLSVLELIAEFEKATGVKVNHKIVGRRAGDIEKIWADTSFANRELGWKAQRSTGETLLSAWNWEKRLRGIK